MVVRWNGCQPLQRSRKWFGVWGITLTCDQVARASDVELPRVATRLQHQNPRTIVSILVGEEEKANSGKLKKEAMNPTRRSLMTSSLAIKLVMISFEAFRIFCFGLFVFYSIERLRNSFRYLWDLCFAICLFGLCQILKILLFSVLLLVVFFFTFYF